jgi:glycosyltransferase involved in cell wall biosynthesis
MLVGERRTDDPDVRLLKRSLAWRAADRACAALTDRLDLQYLLYPSSFGVAADPWFRAAGVVQLFNTHGSYFSHSALPLLSRLRPVVWRLSDMWAVTGHVTYSYECERWRHGCGSCPHLDVYPALHRDRTRALWRWKRTVYARSRITVVAPSRWLERIARDSPLLGRFEIRRIPNGVDLDVFRPRPRAEARRALGLDPGRPVVLFSSVDARDRRKGGHVLAAALSQLRADVQPVILGPDPALPGAVPLGRVDAEERLALAYAAADVFALPTLAENLPNTALEALACGTPTVASDVGGIGDAIRDGETGLLVSPGDPAALASGLDRVLADAELAARLGATGRAVAEREYGAGREAADFAALYEELLAA